MRFAVLQQKSLIPLLYLAALCIGIFSPLRAFAQEPAESIVQPPQPPAVLPPPRTITAPIPESRPERAVDLFWLDDNNQLCIDTIKVTLGRITIPRNTPVNVSVRISRKCNDRAKNAPVPVSATLSTRAGQKSGPSQTVKPEGSAFTFSTSFPYTGNWTVTVVNKFDGDEKHTVSVPIRVVSEAAAQNAN